MDNNHLAHMFYMILDPPAPVQRRFVMILSRICSQGSSGCSRFPNFAQFNLYESILVLADENPDMNSPVVAALDSQTNIMVGLQQQWEPMTKKFSFKRK
jgi:hypothetical protein